MPIIGIDLGTTNSLVAYFTEEGPTIIPNRLGEHLTPSVVSIDEAGDIFVGKIAKERQIAYPNHTAAVFKRYMGAKKEISLGEKSFLPEELSSFIIRSLKEDAEVFLGEEVTEAIISVPAYFNDTQRKATQRAGEMAGLKIGRLINEPTAAAIAYGLQQKEANTKFLVFDLGGGTFDVSILEMYNNIMEVRAVAGDNYLGGEDFTEILIQLFLQKNMLEVGTISLNNLSQLHKQAEMAKVAFSSAREVTMKCKINEELRECSITLEEYEKSCELLLAKLRKPIQRALGDAAIKIKEIDTVLLVGGATKFSVIRSFVGKLFGILPAVHINPDEAVALGAALQGAMKERDKAIKEIVLTDVCPYTLGTSISIERQPGQFEGGHFCPIIERNTIIPVSRTERLYTLYDNQKALRVTILQGESRFAKNNIYLGEIEVPVPPAPAGQQSIDVRYTYDINGLLEVEVTVLATGLKKQIIIEKNPGYMSKEEIEERFKELSNIKIHPRDQEENKLLIARGERLYEETTGDIRTEIATTLQWFDSILDKQDSKAARGAAAEVRAKLDAIEEDWL